MRAHYSPTEQALLDLLLKYPTGNWTINELTDYYYSKRKTRPRHATIVVNKAIHELMDKSTINREKFTIQRIEQVGKTGDLIRILHEKG